MRSTQATLGERFVPLVVTVLWLVGMPAGMAQSGPPSWMTDGPFVAAPDFSLELPLQTLGTKLQVEVEIAGRPLRFVFDTGSPSMIDAALARELGLPVVGQSQGRDAHGTVIQSQIVQADLTLGGVVFRKTPIFAAELSRDAATACLLGNGVLGSEILPLCAWQIDLPDGVLRCATRLEDLDHIGTAQRLRLHDFGYPHAPIFDIGLGRKATSKAMLDTGSPEYLAIAAPDLEGARRGRGVGATRAGHGSAGTSLGGAAAIGPQLLAELTGFSIDGLDLGRVVAMRRDDPPSLLGASLLEHFVVTLDPRSRSAYFESYRPGPFERSGFGLQLSYSDPVSVSLVWEDSPAARAGLKVGEAIKAINGEPVSASCAGIRAALTALGGGQIDLEWDGGQASLARRSPLGR